jgi:hypothetical protein
MQLTEPSFLATRVKSHGVSSDTRQNWMTRITYFIIDDRGDLSHNDGLAKTARV